MAPALLRVWLAYVTQHPGRFLAQLLARASRWFFPGWHVVSILSVLAFACSTFLFRGKGNSAWRTVWMLTIAYSAPFWIAYFEPRDCAVILPELTVLGLLCAGHPGPDLPRDRRRQLTSHVQQGDIGAHLPYFTRQVAANVSEGLHCEDAAQRPLARQGASCAGGVP